MTDARSSGGSDAHAATRRGAFVLVLCVMAAGCRRDHPAETPLEIPSATPSPSAAQAPTHTLSPPPAQVAEPPAPARTLRERLDEYERQWNATGARAEGDAVTDRFVAELAKDRTISDDEIRSAIKANTHDVGKLHEGPVRTYPDRRTMHRLTGIASALRAALRARGVD